MRVSIWRQWASNHSGSFTVVGKFASEDAATKAAHELRHIIATITDWYKKPENAAANERRLDATDKFMGELPLSPPEVTFADQYGVNWQGRGIDWFTLENDTRSVQQVQHTVFVQNTGPTWSSWNPFDALLRKMGGTIVLEAEPYEPPLTTNISCLAPDQATAVQIAEFARRSLSEPDFKKQLPGLLTIFPPDFETQVEQEERRITIRRIYAPPIYESLPRTIDYLTSQGCSEIAFDVIGVKLKP